MTEQVQPDQGGGAAAPIDTNQKVNARQAARILEDRMKARREAAPEPAKPQPAPEPEVAEVEEQPVEDSPAPQPDSDAIEDTDQSVLSDDGADDSDDTDSLADQIHSPEDFEDFKAKIKVDGEEVEVSVKEALESFQFEKHNRQKSQRIAERERQVDREYKQQVEQVGQALQQAKAFQRATYETIQAELARPDIQQLKQSDPQSFLFWQDHVEKRKGEVAQKYQQLAAYEQQLAEQSRAERVEIERQRLREAVPDWGPDKKTKVLKTLETFGYDESDAANMDHRAILAVLRLAELEEKVGNYESQRDKKLKPLLDKNRTARPSAPKNKQQVAKKQLKQSMDNIKGKQGRHARNAAQQAILQRMQRGKKR